MKFVRGLERLARCKFPSAVMWPYQCPVKALLLNKSSIFTTAVWPRLAQPILTSRYSVSLGEYKLNCTIYYFFSYLLAITAVIIFVKNQWTNCPGPTIRTTSVPSRLSSRSSPAKVETENRFYNRHTGRVQSPPAWWWPDIRQQIRMETGQPRDSISTIPVNRLPNIGQKSCWDWLLERERGSPWWWPVPALSPYKESPTHWWRADSSGA